MTPWMQVLSLGLFLVSAVACAALCVYGGVWGAMTFTRWQVRELTFRTESLERQLSREQGIRGKQQAALKKSADEQLAEQMIAAVARRAGPPRPPPQLALPVDAEGLPLPSETEMRQARAQADKNQKS